MLFNTAFFVMFTFFSIILESDSTRMIVRDGNQEKVQPRRDYRPTRWLTNSAMDVWYGNKTFIDIMWREFSDFMYKITERADRSIALGEYGLNKTQENTTQQFKDDIVRVDVRLSNRRTNDTIHTITFDHPLNFTIFEYM